MKTMLQTYNHDSLKTIHIQVPYGLSYTWLERFVDTVRDGLVKYLT